MSMRKLMFLIAIAGGCADSDTNGADVYGPLPAVEDTSGTGNAYTALRDEAEAESPSICDLLPDDDSACAHACDPAAVEAAIPPGTCAVLECPLSDGTVYRTGGCRP